MRYTGYSKRVKLSKSILLQSRNIDVNRDSNTLEMLKYKVPTLFSKSDLKHTYLYCGDARLKYDDREQRARQVAGDLLGSKDDTYK